MKRLLFFTTVFFCLIAYAFVAEARMKVNLPPVRALDLQCIDDAATAHNVPLAALLGILSVEGGRMGEALSNTNGTWDLGAFQINTCHANILQSRGISAESVLTDGCVNAHAAAWLLKSHYERTGDMWEAIGAYHSRTPHRNIAYAQKVRSHMRRLQSQGVIALLRLHEGERP